MTQAQMRMPRHGYRPDGSKPYGPHGPMAPPPHMKVNYIFDFLTYKCYNTLFFSLAGNARSTNVPRK